MSPRTTLLAAAALGLSALTAGCREEGRDGPEAQAEDVTVPGLPALPVNAPPGVKLPVSPVAPGVVQPAGFQLPPNATPQDVLRAAQAAAQAKATPGPSMPQMPQGMPAGLPQLPAGLPKLPFTLPQGMPAAPSMPGSHQQPATADRVIVYGTQTCPACKDLRAQLTARHVAFTFVDVGDQKPSPALAAARAHQSEMPSNVQGYVPATRVVGQSGRVQWFSGSRATEIQAALNG